MPTETPGTVYSFQSNSAGNWLGIKVDGGKVVRFKSDRNDWKLGQAVVISVTLAGTTDTTIDLLRGHTLD